MREVLQRVVLPLALAVAVGPIALHFAAAQGAKDKDKDKDKRAAAAVFELYKDSGDKFRFRLKNADGEILAVASKGYDKKADCVKVVEEIKREAGKAKIEEAK